MEPCLLGEALSEVVYLSSFCDLILSISAWKGRGYVESGEKARMDACLLGGALSIMGNLSSRVMRHVRSSCGASWERLSWSVSGTTVFDKETDWGEDRLFDSHGSVE